MEPTRVDGYMTKMLHDGVGAGVSKLPPYSRVDEPLLQFDTRRSEARDVHPLRGLDLFGPYSTWSLPGFTPAVRIATVGPEGGASQVRELLNSLVRRHSPNDRTDYVPEYRGFESLFKAKLSSAEHDAAHIRWPNSLDELATVGAPHERVTEAIAHAVSQLTSVRGSFDVAVVHLPDSWSPGLRQIGFDAHDQLKAVAAQAGIPTQVVNDRTFHFNLTASRSWRLGLALYAKAGGIPWKLAKLPGVPDGTAYIGLAYALRGDPSDARFVTCCSQVFDSDGGGMQFVAYDAADPIDGTEEARRNPYLSRADMRAVLARSMRTYQARNGGTLPNRVVLHKTTPFRNDELDGVEDALSAVKEIECLEITTSVAWRAVWLDQGRTAAQRSQPDRWPVPRGTLVHMSGTSALLWGAGNTRGVSIKGNFYQGGKSIPRPIMLTRHAGMGPMELASLEAMALTKMDWNNDALYDPIPVTLQYSKVLARTIANVPGLPRSVYPYRLFM